VFGVEGDIDWSSIGRQVTGPVMGIPATFQTQLPWLNTFRARVGYAFGPVLPYVIAGGAFGGVRATDSITIPDTGFVLGGLSDVRLGWTAGAGLEYALNQSLSVKAEYLSVDLGSDILVLDDVTFRAHLIRGAINWRLLNRARLCRCPQANGKFWHRAPADQSPSGLLLSGGS
jgi:opacity protein-like surface antigen